MGFLETKRFLHSKRHQNLDKTEDGKRFRPLTTYTVGAWFVKCIKNSNNWVSGKQIIQ